MAVAGLENTDPVIAYFVGVFMGGIIMWCITHV